MALTVGYLVEQGTKSRSKSSSKRSSKPTANSKLDKQITNKNYIFDDQHLNPSLSNPNYPQFGNQSYENISIYGDRIQKPNHIYPDQMDQPNSNAFTLHPGPSNDPISYRGLGKPPLLAPISKTNYQGQGRAKLSALPEGLQELNGPLVNSARRIIKSEHSQRNKLDTQLHSYDKKESRNSIAEKRSTTPLSRNPQYFNEELALTLEERFQLVAYGGLQYAPPDTRSKTPVLSNETPNTREKTIKAKIPNFPKKLPPSLGSRITSQPDEAESNQHNLKTKNITEATQTSDIDLLKVTGLEPVFKPQTSGKHIAAKQINTPIEEKKPQRNFEKYKPLKFLDKGRENRNVNNLLKESPRQQQHEEELKVIPKVANKRNSFDNTTLRSPRYEEKPQQNPKEHLPKQNKFKLPPKHNARSNKRVSSATQKNRYTDQIGEERLENGTDIAKNRGLATEIFKNNVDTGGFDAWETDSPGKLRSSKLDNLI